MSDAVQPGITYWREADLRAFCLRLFDAEKMSKASAEAAVRVMMHASLVGVDSHGVRLVPHYITALRGGRINRQPQPKFVVEAGSLALLDADHAQGAYGTYMAMDRAVEMARQNGIGAVGVRNSSHFGAAGGYALAAAEAGMIGFAFCNSDSIVRLHGGAERLHGTNPIAMAAPVAGQKPWLLDMATSSIPYNRVLLYRSLGVAVPEGTASDLNGRDTLDASAAEMLAPLGGAFGFKGAALAGVSEILSAVMTGMRLSFDILPMNGPDYATPRELGAFVIAINPTVLTTKEEFDASMARYLEKLRGSRAADGSEVMAPGDREWAVAEQRKISGIPVDPETSAAFRTFAAEFQFDLPEPLRG